MEIQLFRGREFTEDDNASAPGVLIVSQSVARTLWPGEDPIGKRTSMEDDPKLEDWLTVIGVVNGRQATRIKEKVGPGQL